MAHHSAVNEDHRCQHACEETGASNEKDLEIAKMKLEAFELRQKVRDFQSLHERYLSLQHRYDSMVNQEEKKQSDLRGLIEYQTTSAQSMIREIDELKAIQCEQLQRTATTQDQAFCHSQVAEDRFVQLDKAKFEFQRRSDQAMQLRREIAERQRELTKLQGERHERQVQLETEKDRLAVSEQDLEASKRNLMQKRIELEKTDSLKELTVRQVSDRRYDHRQVQNETESLKSKLEVLQKNQGQTQAKLADTQNALDCENATIARTKERTQQVQDANTATTRVIGNLENRKATLSAAINTVNREIDLHEVQLKDDCEVAEMCIRENIMRLTEHSESIKKQNDQLYKEMDEMVKADEFAREKLRRNEVIMRLKERNAGELARSVRMVEQARSTELQAEMAARSQGLCIYCRKYDGVCAYCCQDPTK